MTEREIRDTMAGRIQEARLSARISQHQLADDLGGLTDMVISRWERGESMPSAANLSQLCSRFDRKPAWFFTPKRERKAAAA